MLNFFGKNTSNILYALAGVVVVTSILFERELSDFRNEKLILMFFLIVLIVSREILIFLKKRSR